MLTTCQRNDHKMDETKGKCKQAMERGLKADFHETNYSANSPRNRTKHALIE